MSGSTDRFRLLIPDRLCLLAEHGDQAVEIRVEPVFARDGINMFSVDLTGRKKTVKTPADIQSACLPSGIWQAAERRRSRLRRGRIHRKSRPPHPDRRGLAGGGCG